MSEKQAGATDDRPGWARWWVVAIVAAAGLGLIGFLSSGGDTEPEEELAAVPTTRAETTTTSSAPTTTSTPDTTTTTLIGYESFTIDGQGDEIVEFAAPNDLATVLWIVHEGDSGFTVTTFDDDDQQIEMLVDTIGDYDGSLAVNLLLGDVVSSIQVVADGDWSITATYLGDLERQLDEASGTGDSVLIMDLTAPVMTISHDGASDFSVFLWSFSDQGYVVDDTGPIETTATVPVGGVVVEVKADGNWSLSTRG